jgi:predicted Rossmann fold flavoprotein
MRRRVGRQHIHSMPNDHPLVVVGAGAAGLMGAITAAERGRSVLLLERTADGGRKILISGGGRCNILPSVAGESRFVTDSSPNLLRKLLRSWPLPAQRRFFEDALGIPLVLEAETGKLFPASNRARDVRDRLVAGARARGVTIRGHAMVAEFTPRNGAWEVRLVGGEVIPASRVIVATGGLSVPTTGSDGAGLAVLERLGHVIHPTYPALTPLLADPPVHGDLAGLSLRVTLREGGPGRRRESTDGFLFTHRGYSGPAVLDLSDLAVRSRLRGGPRADLLVQWSAHDAAAWERRFAERGRGTVAGVLRDEIPGRLAERLLKESGIEEGRLLAQLKREERRALVERLTRYPLPWTADEGYRKAEVTGGGVALEEVHPATLESRRHPGLFLCGELLDAFGPIGGYNFAWAWATGRAAGAGAAAGG